MSADELSSFSAGEREKFIDLLLERNACRFLPAVLARGKTTPVPFAGLRPPVSYRYSSASSPAQAVAAGNNPATANIGTQVDPPSESDITDSDDEGPIEWARMFCW